MCQYNDEHCSILTLVSMWLIFQVPKLLAPLPWNTLPAKTNNGKQKKEFWKNPHKLGKGSPRCTLALVNHATISPLLFSSTFLFCFCFFIRFLFLRCFLYSRLERLQQWKDSKKSSSNKTGVRRTGALSSASAASSPVLKTRDGNKKVTFDGLVEKDSPLKSPMRSRTRTTTTTKSNSTARSRSVNCYTCWWYVLVLLVVYFGVSIPV